MPVLSLPGRSWVLGAVLILGTFLAGGTSLAAEPEVTKEYQVKAVFLFNFAQFVTWPSKTFSNTEEPFYIGVLGENPFDNFLDETVKGEKIDGHPLVIRRLNSNEEAKECRILFISRSEDGRIGNILAGLKGLNILTVGDSEGFLKNGGVICFLKEGNKVHFSINPEAAKRANLTISSQVLRLAHIAGPGED